MASEEAGNPTTTTTASAAPAAKAERRRKLPLDEETYALLVDDSAMISRPGPVAKALALRPTAIVGGATPTRAVRILLAHAQRAALIRNDSSLDGASVLRIEVGEDFAEVSAGALAAAVRETVMAYVSEGVPTAHALDGRDPDTWLSLPGSLLDAMATNAVRARRAAEVEAARTLEEAMRSALRDAEGMTEASERERDARIRVDLGLLGRFRERCAELGIDADTALRMKAREIATRDESGPR